MAHDAQRGRIKGLARRICHKFCRKASDFRVINDGRRGKILDDFGRFDLGQLGGAERWHQSGSDGAKKA